MRPDLVPRPYRDAGLADRFRAFIAERTFPCVGAKSAMARGGLEIILARDVTSAWDDLHIYSALRRLVARYRRRPAPFISLAVLFAGPETLAEAEFETALWDRVQSLSDKDAWLGEAHDPRVSSHPSDADFSLSFAGEACFIVGLHPGAGRPARRFEVPALVFNLHDQFERLRDEGRYEQLRRSIIARDTALAGAPNPMLARFGDSSEARQYSGREVGDDWRCPFARKPAHEPHET